MQIVVVRPGESIWAIANRFGVSPNVIIDINQLADSTRLVPGQALVIPNSTGYHIIQSGESIWALAGRYGVTVDQLLQANPEINPMQLTVGTRIKIPSEPKPTIETNGYLEPKGTERDAKIVKEDASALTYFSLFSYQVKKDGSLTPPKDEKALSAIQETNSMPMMVLTNFTEGNFSPDITRSIFTDNERINKLIDSVLATMKSKGYGALNIDFERIYPDDRELYNAFLRKIATRVRQAGYLISTALAPKKSAEQTGPWYSAHDYAAHGQIVDFVILMTYEWGWSGGPPMAVSPLPQVEEVVKYALSVMPADKIMMSAPLYGYDWTLPYKKGGDFAPLVDPQEAIQIAWKRGAVIQYDTEAQAPYYNYYDDAGKKHVVWFEDARSIQAKYKLIKQWKLRGISYWVLGNDFPQSWALLQSEFNIKKLR
ncbi:glycoside hydrolase family 18 protein [Mechercharimyces sp. CAU 1602]|uniref:glycoside hydrolase family 18 protein n=1 Tax=Mechercharimyces sp. CAU 1602 TaxID=2973933 RepID=UPI0021625661|nr:glycoside hydrolase family 18 protein [Mechercharimyces sp. CAU 1602]MCS1351316.1 glycoside hydrolase family 18 protein [Mechercharimyces sp. CAU 1602]